MKTLRSPLLALIKKSYKANVKPTLTGRRKFLTNTAKYSLGSMFLSRIDACNQKDKQVDVAIIGGGIAGLTACHFLKKSGINASIYEANSRIGGRIITASGLLANNITTELGGEFIDSSHKDLLGLCQEFKLPLLDMQSPSEQKLSSDFFFTGRRISEKEIIEGIQPFIGQISKDAQLYENDSTFKNPQTIALDKQSIDEYLEKIGVSGWLNNILKTSYTSELGLESGNQSCLNLLAMLDTNTSDGFEIYGESDERYKIKGGNELIIKELSRGKENHIKTDHVLEQIDKNGSKYVLSFQNEKQVKADFVIVTIPFSVLRNVKINIEMPLKKRNCIDRLGYGTQSKLFLGFKEKIWRKDGFTGYLLSDKVHNGWDGSQMQNNNIGEAGYSFFVGGDRGKNLTIEQAQYFIDELDKVYPKIKQEYNGRNGYYNWFINPYNKGAYACYNVGQMSEFGGYESMPLGNMFFAGEHCSKDFQGFMNGSVETAKKVVARILELVKRGSFE